jgi:hypothetical protein
MHVVIQNFETLNLEEYSENESVYNLDHFIAFPEPQNGLLVGVPKLVTLLVNS